MYGATAGQVGILNFQSSTNQAVCGIFPNENFIPEFIYYRFLEYQDQLIQQAVGGAQPNISQQKIKNTLIPEINISEQKKIVAILDKAFEAIDQAKANIERNIENAKELFQSKLNEIFSQQGEGWEEKSFQELSSRIGDGLHGTPQYDDEGDYFFINGNNLNDGVIEIKDSTKRVNRLEFEKHQRPLTDNTVQISINGTLGKVAFYNNEPVILGKSACYINFDSRVEKRYIKFLVQSTLFFENMGRESTGATIKNFSLKSMRNYKLFLPPVEAQVKIVGELELFDSYIKELKESYFQKFRSLEELKKSLLQKAFAGELTQDEAKVKELINEPLGMVAEERAEYNKDS